MKGKGDHWIRGILITLIVFAVIFTGGVMLFRHIDRVTAEEETEMVREAVRSAALTCYAVEGAFPQNLAYLQNHYGLAFDESIYFVSYDAFASNIMPSITVMVKGDESL